MTDTPALDGWDKTLARPIECVYNPRIVPAGRAAKFFNSQSPYRLDCLRIATSSDGRETVRAWVNA